ncbi:MAG TPA: type 4a pilus biogenesis protein PilO [Candidatus Woesebacteria bacterium]|nr:type 4a pilus biogenesis protein PilO [Candidatus Woesebacteria bacterium]
MNKVSSFKPLVEYLRKQQENKKFLKTVEVTATFTLISFFLYFAIRPTAITISSLVGEIKSKEILKKELRTKINNIIAAQDSFSEVQSRYQVVNSSLPDRYYLDQAYQQIVKNGELSGVTVSNGRFDFDEKKLSGTIGKVGFPVAIDTSFTTALAFLENLQKSRRLIDVSKITIQPAANSTDSTKVLNFSLDSQLIYWPNQNEKK